MKTIEPNPLELPVSHKDLAPYAGTTPEDIKSVSCRLRRERLYLPKRQRTV
ncbi:hypothetical protein [Arthrobacter rhombi]|uniref:hypothetical protein n=1 Tax=Arthrobacter rhombi TaxID=71253 RepID=UPI003FD1BEB9